jgi:uncharacterized protein (TIGR04255 family)
MEEGVLRVALEHRKADSPPQAEVLVLDFDFGQTDNLVAADVVEYLERAHRQTKRIFLELISEKYLAVMRSPGR